MLIFHSRYNRDLYEGMALQGILFKKIRDFWGYLRSLPQRLS